MTNIIFAGEGEDIIVSGEAVVHRIECHYVGYCPYCKDRTVAFAYKSGVLRCGKCHRPFQFETFIEASARGRKMRELLDTLYIAVHRHLWGLMRDE